MYVEIESDNNIKLLKYSILVILTYNYCYCNAHLLLG
jgi:hypothetical protein